MAEAAQPVRAAGGAGGEARAPWPALAFHGVFCAFMLAPLVVVALVSFTDKAYIALPFDGASWRWYTALAHEPQFVSAFWRSVVLGGVAATLATAVAVPAGLAIAWYRFPLRDGLQGLLLSPLMVPHVVLGIALLRFLTLVGGSSTMWGLTLAHTVIVLPFVLRLVVAAATGLDHSLSQAAASLGATGWTVFRRVQLPLILPGVAGGWLLAFINSFDELTMSVFVASASTETLPVRMYNHMAHTIDPLLASVSTGLIALTLVLMLVLDRFFGLDRVLSGRT